MRVVKITDIPTFTTRMQPQGFFFWILIKLFFELEFAEIIFKQVFKQ